MPMSVIQVICTDSLAALDARSSSFDDAAFALGLLLSQTLEDEGVRCEYASLLTCIAIRRNTTLFYRFSSLAAHLTAITHVAKIGGNCQEYGEAALALTRINLTSRSPRERVKTLLEIANNYIEGDDSVQAGIAKLPLYLILNSYGCTGACAWVRLGGAVETCSLPPVVCSE
jgi:hypothetical protein